ncbi:MAG: GFA family protein [Inquilinus limosus]|uniref:GFA family protein n=1 Tax=Inquilinus limosus TaxID=171674 RepID=A0A952FPF3_9PROT|nr:GFA family protein [Inquilinus limosus]
MSDYPVLRPEPRVDADGTRLRQGGCSCGAVRFTLRGEPLVVGICHCTECRKATGVVAMGYADWPGEAFTVTGEVRTYRGRSFCPVCGSRLFHPNELTATAPRTPRSRHRSCACRRRACPSGAS